MASYLILKDPKICPSCHCEHRTKRIRHFRDCPVCGIPLFLRPIIFTKWEDDGGRRDYWMFSKTKGWVSRDYIMANDAPAAQIRDQVIIPPPRNTVTTPEEVAKFRGGKVLKHRRPVNPKLTRK